MKYDFYAKSMSYQVFHVRPIFYQKLVIVLYLKTQSMGPIGPVTFEIEHDKLSEGRVTAGGGGLKLIFG